MLCLAIFGLHSVCLYSVYITLKVAVLTVLQLTKEFGNIDLPLFVFHVHCLFSDS